ncbi:MAG: 30S ribosomal protein S5 [Candidatus Kerfeldbacteria bacterium]|nr:30S ribosomal protein S5 [Candidatus Kerfeldbacteria bacterium]
MRRDRRPARGGRGRSGDRNRDRDHEFDHQLIDLARVTRVMAGGKRMRFRACVIIGDHKGRVGFGVMKGADVQMAINKAMTKAKKHLIRVPMVNATIPHEVYYKEGSAKVLLRPARTGRGIIAGGSIRAVLELAGVHNVVSKMLGSNNKINNVRSTILALSQLKTKERYQALAKFSKKPTEPVSETPRSPKE